MIDPIHSLAFSIQASPGVYAVLVGSGVSRAAGIPTGWEVTLDLIRKLAELHDKTFGPDPEDPERWYKKKFKKNADYADLLDELARTPAERQQRLRGNYEPNDRERDEGEKKPTAAHRAGSRHTGRYEASLGMRPNGSLTIAEPRRFLSRTPMHSSRPFRNMLSLLRNFPDLTHSPQKRPL